MKKLDIAAGLLLAILVAIVWIVVTRPPWVFRRLPTAPQSHQADADFRSRESRHAEYVARMSRQAADGATDGGPVFAIRDSDTRAPITSFEFRMFPDNPVDDEIRSAQSWTAINNARGYLRLADIDSAQERTNDLTVLVVRADGYSPERALVSKLVMDWNANPAIAPRILLYHADQRPLTRMESRIGEVFRQFGKANHKAAPVELGPAKPGEPCRLSGVVTFEGSPAASGEVSISAGDPADGVSTHLEADGHYQIDSVPSGNIAVRIHAADSAGHWRDHDQSLYLAENQAAEFNYEFHAIGIVSGTVSGLHEDEVGGVFAIKGNFELGNVTEDDLYDFGDIADGEAHIRKDGSFAIQGLDAGLYTLVAIAQHFGDTNDDRAFWYVSGKVDVPADAQITYNLAFDNPESGQN